MGLIQEFKEFAVKGNAMDMAVGLVIGAGFGKIVTSLVNDVIMPPVGFLLGGVDFKKLEVLLKEASTAPNGDKIEAVALRYGLFINTIIDFLIVAFTIFIALKAMNRLMDARKLIPGRRGAPSA